MTYALREGERPCETVVSKRAGRGLERSVGPREALLIFVAVLWVVMGVVPAFFESPAWTLEDRMMAGLVTGAPLSLLIAWWREGVGGLLLLVSGVAHSAFAYFVVGRNIPLAMAISGGPFLAIGVLFLVARRRPAEVPIER